MKGALPMKLIIAIISNDDSYDVLSELTKAGFDATKLSTTGGFLSAGNVTLLIGVEDSRVDDVMEILRENSSRRTQLMTAAPAYNAESFVTLPVQVAVGGELALLLRKLVTVLAYHSLGIAHHDVLGLHAHTLVDASATDGRPSGSVYNQLDVL